uniref:Complex I assembly factor TIMMDC1, mitochondrial n=1 Tax=Angiostrongylus cantonensis TaxID=6313 RepID=A0A158P709_ANGCA
MTTGPPVQSTVASFLSLSYWTEKYRALSPPIDLKQSEQQDSCPSTSNSSLQENQSSTLLLPSDVDAQLSTSQKISGWHRMRSLYEEPCMERDYSHRIIRMAFLTGFFLGGCSTVAQARETFERSNVGRKYLSPSDEFKRKADYAIVRFAKSGFVMGFKCALISGSIVVLTTHLAAYRQRFSSWYFPAISGALALSLHRALVGGIFMFPLGIIGSLKAVALGVTSGLTLSAGMHIFALGMNKSVDEAYWAFKEKYDNKLRTDQEWQDRVTELMKSEGIKWRGNAAVKLRKLDEEKLAVQDA